jgi:hypothetical protein
MVAAVAVEYALLALGAAAALLALLRLRAIARFAAQPLAPASAWRPPATVLLPVRGEHHGFADNLRALASQDYPDYELLLVADSFDDPAARAVRALQADLPRLRLVVSEEPRQGWGSGKIAALVGGLRHVRPSSEVLVFADADIRPTPSWLASLVAPLADPAVGGVTGFQSYRAAARPTWWTALRDASASLALELQASAKARFLWGGSMAVRRADFDRSDVLAREWPRHVCDDTGLTEALKRLGLRIAFAPGALVAAPEDWTRREVAAWLVRQYALVRTIDPKGTRPVTAVMLLAVLAMGAGLGLLLAGPTPLLRLAGALLLVPTLLAPVRAYLREGLARRALPTPRSRSELVRLLLLTPLLPFPMLWALVQAARAEAIHWRGRSYAIPPAGAK